MKLLLIALLSLPLFASANEMNHSNHGEHHNKKDHSRPTPNDFTVEIEDLGYTITGRWNNGGPVAGDEIESSFIMRVVDSEEQKVTSLLEELKIDARMKMGNMEHPTAPINITAYTAAGDGYYLVSNIYFTMQGEWKLRFLPQFEDMEPVVYKLNVEKAK